MSVTAFTEADWNEAPIAYRSRDVRDSPLGPFEKEEFPECVDRDKEGNFTCDCGQHEVRATKTMNPIGDGGYMTHVVRLIQ